MKVLSELCGCFLGRSLLYCCNSCSRCPVVFSGLPLLPFLTPGRCLLGLFGWGLEGRSEIPGPSLAQTVQRAPLAIIPCLELVLPELPAAPAKGLMSVWTNCLLVYPGLEKTCTPWDCVWVLSVRTWLLWATGKAFRAGGEGCLRNGSSVKMARVGRLFFILRRNKLRACK